MQIEMRLITSIRPYENNPRLNDAGVDAVAVSIKQFGFRQPIVVDEDSVIIVGHTRYKAALKLGMDEVPVHVAVGLSPAQAKAYRIADNQTATLSHWDDDKLPLELAQLQQMDFDLNLTGFSADELMRLLGSETNEGQADPDAVPEPPDGAITQPGDLWLLGKRRLLCGDSSKAEEVDRLLDRAAIHLVNTDPPYNVKVEPRSNNAIAAGLSSFQRTTHHQGLDVARHPEKSQPTTKKLRAKDRPLANDFVSEEEFDRLLLAWFGNIQALRADMVQRTAGALTAAGLEFVKTLIALQSAPTPPATRLGAARAGLELGMKVREVADLEQRLAELERRFEEQNSQSTGV